ncbi:MAG: DEAD/DEAH box helicase [Anaerolineales bacterium]
MTHAFDALGLHPDLVQAVIELGYEAPTPIQEQMIPLMLQGGDVIGQAQTGTGKTAAFALPILNNLQPKSKSVQCLILAPTRELALQVSKAFEEYGKYRPVRVLPVYGGQSYMRQISALKRGVEVVVGTPGRLLDLMQQGALDLSGIHTLVLDEADEMLSMGFIEDIETILRATPEARQAALFSATMPPPIRQLAERYLKSPRMIAIESKQRTVDTIEQRYYLVNESDRLAALTRIFEVEPITSALIFARTRVSSGDLANALTARGYPAEVLNGDLAQEARERVLERFRQNKIKVLVATDVAARGLDIEDISHVFNYELPHEVETYLHRVGRTGRAGKSGVAISLVTPAERIRLRRIETFTRQRMTAATVPTAEEIIRRRENMLVERMRVWLQRGRCRQEREIAATLVAEGHDPLDVAAAALKLSRADEKQQPIAPMSEVVLIERARNLRRESREPRASREHHAYGEGRRESNAHERGSHYGRESRGANSGSRGKRSGATNFSHEAGMVRLSLSKGRAHGIRPNDVVSSIAYQSGIPGNTIGKIKIQEDFTYVDVPEDYVDQVLAHAGSYRIKRQAVEVEVAG